MAAKVSRLPVQDKTKTDIKSVVVIKEPNYDIAKVKVKGVTPYIQNRFSAYQQDAMKQKQEAGSSSARTRKNKPPKDFQRVYEGSMHVSQEGWYGIPATAFRNAMIDACRLTEFDMIRAKMCITIVEDGRDRENLEPLVRITKGEPRMFIDRVRIGMNQTDLSARAMFEQWEATITVEWDADVFQASDIFNLINRAGRQVGIGAGRPLSKTSAGTGKGTFKIVE